MGRTCAEPTSFRSDYTCMCCFAIFNYLRLLVQYISLNLYRNPEELLTPSIEKSIYLEMNAPIILMIFLKLFLSH